MKRVQRRAHLVIWIILTPALLWVVVAVLRGVGGSG